MPRTLFVPASGAVLRAPMLPVERYRGLADGIPPDATDGPDVREALEAASPVLAASLDRPARDARRDAARDSSLLRYLIRMSTRPTPFGLFAGVGLVRWGDVTDVRLADRPRPVRARPDMAWLLGFVLDLERELGDRGALVAHGCLVERGGRIVLADPTTGGRTGPEVSVRATPAVRAVLARARSPVPVTTLVDDVAAVRGAPRERVAGLVGELARAGLLLSDLRPPLTADPIAHVARRLAAVPGGAQRAAELITIADGADGADGAGDRAGLAARLRALHPGADGDGVQLDSALPLTGDTVATRIGSDAARAADLLLRLHPAPGGPPHLAAYRAALVARWGTGTVVGLLDLLDPRTGLGPPARPGAARTGRADPAAARRGERLRELALAALRDGRTEVELDDALLDAIRIRDPRPEEVPDGVELSAFVAAGCRAELDRGEHLLVVGPNLGGQAAGRGLGRFADLLGPDATALLRELHAAHEPFPGVDAELVYLPGRRRSANVAVRPAVCTHEIAVGVSPGVPDDRVIRPDELGVLVRDGRLRLWWDRGGCEVRVHAGHMLNTGTAPALCRFLSEIGQDGVTPLTPFGWGAAAGFPRLPRVRRGRVVLALARWQLPRARARDVLAVAGGRDGVAPALRRWREEWRVPRHVYLGAGDNRLLLDLDDPAQADQIRRDLAAERGPDLVLHEALPGPDDAWLPGPGGAYLTELVVPLTRRQHRVVPRPQQAAPRPAAPVPDGDRFRRPGSDWLYLHLYGPAEAQDELVGGALGDLARAHDGPWFFLRYRDPQPHLRLRLHGDPETLLTETLPEITGRAARLMGSGLLTRVSVEVYDREIARYGGPDGLAVAERIFVADSAAVAAMLPARDGPDRVALAVLGVDDLLDALGLDPPARLNWTADVAPPPRTTAAEYRRRSGELRRLLSGGAPDPVRAALDTRRAAVASAAGQLRMLEADGRLTVALPVLARSLAHLHCNRMGVDQALERTVLGLLRRTRDSLRAAPADPGRTGHDRAETKSRTRRSDARGPGEAGGRTGGPDGHRRRGSAAGSG